MAIARGRQHGDHFPLPLIGNGCASVFSTYSSSGITESSENSRYKYLRVSAPATH